MIHAAETSKSTEFDKHCLWLMDEAAGKSMKLITPT